MIAAIPAVADPPPTPGEGSRVYTKVFEDHFEDEELNDDYWTFGLRDPATNDLIPGAAGDHLLNNSYDGYATEEDTYLEDGALVLRNQKRNYTGTSPAGSFNYTTGWVMSMHKVYFNKGYIEFRAQFPKGDKVWPALWLIPERLAWPPEWDLWEYFGYRSDVGYNVMGTHLATGPNWQNVTWHSNWIPNFTDTYGSEQWHVFGFEWTETGARWWIDGQLVNSINASAVGANFPDEDFYIVMNNGTKSDSPDTNTTWPNYLKVDYVEVYQLKTPPSSEHQPIQSGWLKTAPTLELEAEAGDSPADRIEWRYAGDDEWVTYSGPVSLAREGVEVEVEYRAIGVDGSVETPNTLTYSLDTKAPTTVARIESGGQAVDGDELDPAGIPYTVHLDAEDDLSGVTYTAYCLGEECEPAAYEEPLQFDSPGGYVIRFASLDNAYNEEEAKELRFTIRRHKSTTGLKVAPKKPKAGRKVKLTASVKLPNAGFGPDGKVTFRFGKKKRSVKVAKNGKAVLKVKLPGKKGGKLKVKARYEGTATIAPSTAKTVKVKLR